MAYNNLYCIVDVFELYSIVTHRKCSFFREYYFLLLLIEYCVQYFRKPVDLVRVFFLFFSLSLFFFLFTTTLRR